jgi:hypothetical protein
MLRVLTQPGPDADFHFTFFTTPSVAQMCD